MALRLQNRVPSDLVAGRQTCFLIHRCFVFRKQVLKKCFEVNEMFFLLLLCFLESPVSYTPLFLSFPCSCIPLFLVFLCFIYEKDMRPLNNLVPNTYYCKQGQFTDN